LHRADSQWKEGAMEMFNSEAVKKRLESFGYEAKKEDEPSLDFCVGKTQNSILNKINWKELPEGLEYIAVDMAAGEFLQAKKTFAPDDLSMLDLSSAVKQIQSGDTNTVFAIGSGSLTREQRLDIFISHLLSYGKGEINSFRRLRW